MGHFIPVFIQKKRGVLKRFLKKRKEEDEAKEEEEQKKEVSHARFVRTIPDASCPRTNSQMV